MYPHVHVHTHRHQQASTSSLRSCAHSVRALYSRVVYVFPRGYSVCETRARARTFTCWYIEVAGTLYTRAPHSSSRVTPKRVQTAQQELEVRACESVCPCMRVFLCSMCGAMAHKRKSIYYYALRARPIHNPRVACMHARNIHANAGTNMAYGHPTTAATSAANRSHPLSRSARLGAGRGPIRLRVGERVASQTLANFAAAVYTQNHARTQRHRILQTCTHAHTHPCVP